MTERTLQQALEHADNARSAVAYYPREFRSSDPIATTAGDLVLLADEVHRLQKWQQDWKDSALAALGAQRDRMIPEAVTVIQDFLEGKFDGR